MLHDDNGDVVCQYGISLEFCQIIQNSLQDSLGTLVTMTADKFPDSSLTEFFRLAV